MNRTILFALLAVASCGDGGNYGALPIVGQKANCHHVVDAVLERTMECNSTYMYPAEFETYVHACDDALSLGHVDIEPCIAAIKVWSCDHVDKLPMQCEGLFNAI